MISLPLSQAQVSLNAVLACGQSFRWSSVITGNITEHRLCLRDRVVCLQQNQDQIICNTLFPDNPSPVQLEIRNDQTLAWLRDYFQLHIDLTALYDQWAARDNVFARFRERFPGIRILRQDPWENVVSFICSSNNNISRITKMVHGLCNHFSPVLLSMPDPANPKEMIEYHPFPPPSVLAKPEVAATLRKLGFGYRAEFIQRTAKFLVESHGADTLPDDPTEAAERWLKSLRDKSTEEARVELLKLTGVGRKVADCILLMSLDKKEVVPVDTHVHQIAVKYYGMKGSSGKTSMTPKLYDEVNSKLVSIWGDYAGWAHSVMFTADLKSFADYNSTPSTSPQKKTSIPKRKRQTTDVLKEEAEQEALPTPPLTPGATTLTQGALTIASSSLKTEAKDEDLEMTLIERVKRRRTSKRT